MKRGGERNKNPVSNAEAMKMLAMYQELIPDMPKTRVYRRIANEFNRHINTPERAIRRILKDEKQKIIDEAKSAIVQGKPIDLPGLCTNKAIDIYVNVLFDDKYKVGEKQWQAAKAIITRISKATPSKPEEPLPE